MSQAIYETDHYIYSPDDGYDQVAKLNIFSKAQTILTQGSRDAETPDPSSDGSKVTYAALSDDGTYQVGLVKANGDSEHLATSSSLDLEEPDWSGDGVSIAVARWFGLTSQIGLVTAATGGFTALTDSSAIRDHPDVFWNPLSHTNLVVYEREDTTATDGFGSGRRRRPGSGIFLVQHRSVQDGAMTAGVVTELRRATPNPAAGPISVYWQVAVAGTDATVKVYDAAGRQVSVLFAGKAPVGLNQAVWCCRDERGREVAPGVYFCTLETSEDRISRKVVLTAGK